MQAKAASVNDGPGRGEASAPSGSPSGAGDNRPRPGASHGRRTGQRSWRVRTRVVVLVLVPTLVAVGLGAFSVANALGGVGDYQRVGHVAEVTKKALTLVHELGLERDLAARYIAGGRGDEADGALRKQEKIVDKAVIDLRRTTAIVGDDHPEQSLELVARVLSRLDELSAVRETVSETELLALSGIRAYSLVITDLLGLVDETSQGSRDEPFNRSVRALSDIARAKEALSIQRGIMVTALAEGRFTRPELDSLVAARSQESSLLAAFVTDATLDQRQAYELTVTGSEVDDARLILGEAIAQANARPASLRLDVQRENSPGAWFKAASGSIDKMRAVEQDLVEQVGQAADDLRAAELRAAVISGVVILLLLALVVVFTGAIARSLTRPLRRLQREALEVANVRLPGAVNATRGDSPGQVPVVKPIGIHSRDEIGEVARAFDEVHREAVRLAVQEAQLRANVNAMFVNLSRRSQTLVERQLRIIDSLEQGEQDGKRLESFFKLDHLATRMRRNSENLLVLAGQDQPRRWGQPVPLVDVLRAAVSEVEQYQRISMRLQPGISIVGQAVNDVVHLVAELAENATMYSPEDTPVVIAGHPLGGSGGEVMLSISDNGIGMVPAELADANQRLAEPQSIDVSVSRRMGLFVVSRLASRHGIRVQLRPSQVTGITALILLPASIVSMGGAAESGSYQQPQVPQAPRVPVESGRPALRSGGEAGLAGYAAQSPPPPVQSPPVQSPSSPWPQSPAPPQSPAVSPSAGRVSPAQGWPSPAVTGPIPAGSQEGEWSEPVSGPGDGVSAGERLPIFDSVESDWFRRVPVDSAEVGGQRWRSPGDEGWSAAEAASVPHGVGETAAGLPKRVPRANLVPGSVGQGSAFSGVAAAPSGRYAPSAEPPPVTPDRVRSRLAGLQRGIRQAREGAGGDGLPDGQQESS